MSQRKEEHKAFVARLDGEVTSGDMKAGERDDLLAQKELFDAALAANSSQHKGKVVGYAAGEKFIGGSISDLLKQARQKHPGRLTYFEQM